MMLSPLEIRVLGVLLEKELTTPDQYPLSLNALTTACNQKTNREPVLDLPADEVQAVVDGLNKKGLVAEQTFGSRTVKFKHRFCNTEFSVLHLNPKELACLCVMFVRGPQTPGELKARTTRLHAFNDNAEVESTLKAMLQRDGDPWVVRLPKESGRRDFRYMHLFGDAEINIEDFATSSATSNNSASTNADRERIANLEELVAEMRAEIDELKQQLAELNT